MRLGWAVLVAALVSGCAFNPQQANIQPNLKITQSNEGAGTTVSFRVVDERETKQLGNRGAAIGKAAKITAKQDVAAIVDEHIRQGLTARGFRVTAWDEAEPVRLSVELRALNYSTSTGFFTGGVEVKSALKAIGVRNSKPYERMYRTDEEKRVVVVPTAGQNEQWLNTALTDVLSQLFDDVGLMRHLAGK